MLPDPKERTDESYPEFEEVEEDLDDNEEQEEQFDENGIPIL